jgi:hypothetical protein
VFFCAGCRRRQSHRELLVAASLARSRRGAFGRRRSQGSGLGQQRIDLVNKTIQSLFRVAGVHVGDVRACADFCVNGV